MAFTEKITCKTKEYLLTTRALYLKFKQEDSQHVIANRLTCQQALYNRRKRQHVNMF
jgi:hypothetical protein